MGFFSKIFKVFKRVALPLAAAYFGGPLIGSALGTAGGAAASGAAGGLSGFLGSSGIGSALSGVSNVLGAINTFKSATGALSGSKGGGSPRAATATAFKPKQLGAMNAPSSLSNLAGYAPEQTRSALATKGLNQGLGADEDSYYRNLVSRSLIGDKNKITSDTNSLLPVESQYFSRQGIDTGNVTNFLRALSAK